MNTKHARIIVALGVGLTLAVVWQSVPFAQSPVLSAAEGPVPSAAEGTTRYVAPDGDDANDCASAADRCRSIQRAVDVANAGDEILVASGTYTGVRNVPSLNTSMFSATQVVAITKTLTLRGGYSSSDWGLYDPLANPTTVDAEGAGRALVIIGPGITPTVEGLRITGGDATGLEGTASKHDAGGGVYISGAAPTLSDCVVISNTASRDSRAYGGGLYLTSARATLRANAVQSNTASANEDGYGGGLCVRYSDAVLSGNSVQNNTASLARQGFGGGLYLEYNSPTLRGNTVQSNTASTGGTGRGGGVGMERTENATLDANTVRGNTASTGGAGDGGGVFVTHSSHAQLSANIIQANRASTAGNGHGGGVYVDESHNFRLIGSTVQANVASTAADGYGGGVHLESSENAILGGNTIVGNVAALEPAAWGGGGGVNMKVGGPFTMTNNLVARNHAQSAGSGLLFRGWTGGILSGRLLHTTVADNVSDGDGGDGVYVDLYTTLALTNTLVSGHGSVGVRVMAFSTATLDATLWYGNGTDIGGVGTILTGTVNVYGDPAFVDPAAGDYHIGAASAAIDAGIDAGITEDIDGDPRPSGDAFDIGADEYRWHRVHLPLIQKDWLPGSSVKFNVRAGEFLSD